MRTVILKKKDLTKTINVPETPGQVLWISNRDGNGIIKSSNKEFHFDSSEKEFNKLKRKDNVLFKPVLLRPDNIYVAKDIRKI